MLGRHNKIIADAAREVLQPLCFRRVGRSRVWIADHLWWLTLVEFQSSGFSKGTYLNVAAHWLWTRHDFLSFDYGGRVGSFEGYDSDEQFATAVLGLAEAAAAEHRKLARAFARIEDTAEILLGEERSSRAEAKGSWGAYNAGMDAAIAGRSEAAVEMFSSIADDRARVASVEMEKLVSRPLGLKRMAMVLIGERRSALKLDPLPGMPF